MRRECKSWVRGWECGGRLRGGGWGMRGGWWGGGGAGGVRWAFEAGKRGRRVLLLEHGERVGRKILISGGGRCNFTNVGTKAENFLSENPHFAKSALARFTPKDFVALVEKHGIKYHEKTLGQLFCDDSARLIVGMLERECAEA